MVVPVFIGLFCMLAGGVIYHGIGRRFKEQSKSLPKWDRLIALAVHMPAESSKAGPHILANILFFFGFCLLLSTPVLWATFEMIQKLPILNGPSGGDSMKIGYLGLQVGIATLFFNVVVSATAFWTLWQTKRIDFKQGHQIQSFSKFIEEAAAELEKLNGDFINDSMGQANSVHRVYIIAHNPFFGMLSFPTSRRTNQFGQHLNAIARSVAVSKKQKGRKAFELKVMTGSPDEFDNFHEKFHKKKGGGIRGGDASGRREYIFKKVNETTEEAEKKLEALRVLADQSVVVRTPRVPPIQFMVIGNLLYEFTTDEIEPDGLSDISVREDRKACDVRVRTFELLEELYSDVQSN